MPSIAEVYMRLRVDSSQVKRDAEKGLGRVDTRAVGKSAGTQYGDEFDKASSARMTKRSGASLSKVGDGRKSGDRFGSEFDKAASARVGFHSATQLGKVGDGGKAGARFGGDFDKASAARVGAEVSRRLGNLGDGKATGDRFGKEFTSAFLSDFERMNEAISKGLVSKDLRIRVNSAGLQEQLAKVTAEAAKASGDQTLKVSADTIGAQVQLRKLELTKSELGKNVKIKVDVDKTALSRLKGAFGGAGGDSGSVFNKALKDGPGGGGGGAAGGMMNPAVIGTIAAAGLAVLPGAMAAVGALGGVALGAAFAIRGSKALKSQGGFLLKALDGTMIRASQVLIKPIHDAMSVLAGQLPTIGRLFSQTFSAVAPLVGPIVRMFTGLVETFLPGFNVLMRAAAKPLSLFFVAIGKIIGSGFGKFLAALAPAVGPSLSIITSLVNLVIAFLPPVARLANILAIALAPVMRVLATVAGKFAGVLTKVFIALVPLANTFAAFVTALAPLIPPLLTIGLTLLTGLVIPALNKLTPILVRDVIPAFNKMGVFISTVVVPALNRVAAFLNTHMIPAFVSARQHIVNDFVLPLVHFFTDTLPHAWGVTFAAVKSVFTAVAHFFTAVWNGIKSVILTVVGAIGGFLSRTWTNISNGVKSAFNGIAHFFSSIWNGIKAVFTTVVGAVAGLLGRSWTNISNGIKSAWNAVAHFFGSTWTNISNGVKSAWNAIAHFFASLWTNLSNGIKSAWNAVSHFFGTTWTNISNGIKSAWNAVAHFFGSLWTNVSNGIKSAWNAVSHFFGSTWTNISNGIKSAWNAVLHFFGSLWTNIFNGIKSAWNAVAHFFGSTWTNISRAITTAWHTVQNFFGTTWTNIFNGVKSAWNAIIHFFQSTWNTIKGVFTTVVGAIGHALEGAWTNISNAAKSAWNGIVRSITSIWNGIKRVVGAPINVVVGFINTMIGGVDAVLSAIGVKGGKGNNNPHGGPLGTIPGVHFARGGKVVAGSHEGADDVPAWIGKNETVVSADHSRVLAPVFSWIGVPGYAKGGVPNLSMYRNPLPGNSYGVSRIDQGVDFTGPGPVAAIGAGQVQHVATGNTGWGPPAGPAPGLFMTYRLSTGPLAGSSVYVAEGANPVVRVGQRIAAGQHIATMNGSSIETGFANSSGTGALSQTAAAASGNWQNSPGGTAVGQLFEELLLAVGVKRAPNFGKPAAGKIPGNLPGGKPDFLSQLTQLAKNAGGGLIGAVVNSIEDLIGLGIPGPLKAALNSLLGLKSKASGSGVIGQMTGGIEDYALGKVTGWVRGEAFDKLKTVFAALIGSSGGGGPVGATNGSSTQNGVAIYKYLLANLFHGNKIASAGAIASMWGESAPPGWNPESKGSGGFGIMGWTPGYAGVPPAATGNAAADIKVQIAHIIPWLRASGDIPGRVAQVAGARSVAEAAQLWGTLIERFGISDVHGGGIAAATDIMQKNARGGLIPGYAPGHDTVRALLSPGEFVMNPRAVRAVGVDTLHAMNNATPTYGSGPGFASGGSVDIFGASNANRLSPFIHHAHVNSGVEGALATRDTARFARAVKGTGAVLLWEGYNDIASGVGASAVAGANAAKINAAHQAGVPVVIGSLERGSITNRGRLAQISAYNKWAAGAADAYAAIGSSIPAGQIHGDSLAYTTIAHTVDARFATLLKRAAAAKAKVAKVVSGKLAASAASRAASSKTADQARILKLGSTRSHLWLTAQAKHYQAKMQADALRGNITDYAGTAAALADVQAALGKWSSPLNAQHDKFSAIYKTANANAQAALNRGDERGFMLWNQKALADQSKVRAVDAAIAGAVTAVDTKTLNPVQKLAYAFGTSGASKWKAVANQLLNHSLNPQPVGNLSKADMSRLALNATPSMLAALYAGPGSGAGNWQALATGIQTDLFNGTGIYGAGSGVALGLLGKLTGKHGQYSGKKFAKGGTISEPVYGVGASGQQYTFGEQGRERIVPGGSDPMMAALNRLAAAMESAPARTAAGVAKAIKAPAGQEATAARLGARG
jgi:phage-related protein